MSWWASLSLIHTLPAVLRGQMVSEKPAREVVAKHTAQPDKREGPSIKKEITQLTFQSSMVGVSSLRSVVLLASLQGVAVFDVVPATEGERYSYEPPSQDLLGPGVPELEELGAYG